jgi:hypothetical protein
MSACPRFHKSPERERRDTGLLGETGSKPHSDALSPAIKRKSRAFPVGKARPRDRPEREYRSPTGDRKRVAAGSRSGSGLGSSRSLGSGLGRHALGHHALGDDRLAAAGTAGAATLDDPTATGAGGATALDDLAAAGAAIAAAGDSLAAARLAGSRSGLAVATATVMAAVAPLTVAALAVQLGEQAAVALAGTVAAVAGHRTGVTAHEGDGDERKEHCNRETEETLHLNPPDGNSNATCVPEAVTNGTPIRDGHRTAADSQP